MSGFKITVTEYKQNAFQMGQLLVRDFYIEESEDKTKDDYTSIIASNALTGEPVYYIDSDNHFMLYDEIVSEEVFFNALDIAEN